MKILLLDIETAPNTAYVWGLFDQNISHDHVEVSSYILCWSAKWLGSNHPIMYSSVQSTPAKTMLAGIHSLMDEADVIVHFNGMKFDIPTLNKEFIKYGFNPPSPYRQVDLYRAVRATFRFESNKMDAICTALGLGHKTKHQGFGLWVGCMKGDLTCWKKMKRYNQHDVRIMERLYYRVLPWMKTHPHVGALEGHMDACPLCGVTGKMQKRGMQIARTCSYQRFQCQSCGGWSRSRLAEKAQSKPRYV